MQRRWCVRRSNTRLQPTAAENAREPPRLKRRALDAPDENTLGMNVEALKQLADLVFERNSIDKKIGRIVGRPPVAGHLAEYVSSEIFEVDLQPSASNKGFDGRFRQGKLAGRTVDIKWKGKRDGTLNLSARGPLPDFYLVLTGTESAPGSSRGEDRPWRIDAVYLFDTGVLIATLSKRGVKIGTASSVGRELWEQSEVFPRQRSLLLVLDESQQKALALFDGNEEGV